MAKYINKYETVAAYEADTQKDYPNVSYIAATDEVVWQKEKPYEERYFTTIALEDGKISNSANTLSYSTDGGQTWSTPGTAPSINVLEGDKIMWKGTKAGNFSSKVNNSKNSLFKVEGNVMSLIYGDDFQGQTTLTQIRELGSLFNGCIGLVSAENLILPATTLTIQCYNSMFAGCTSLTAAPELPATTLANYCYMSMFKNCSNLVSIKCLATSFGSDSLMGWVDGVAATGTFTKAANMTGWTTGVNGIPTGWTVVDAQ